MEELALQWMMSIKLLVVLVCAMLYAFGGMKGKWKRRFLAPGIYVSSMIGLSLILGTFHWSIITLAPIYILGLCMGYGGTTNVATKIFKRALCGAVIGLSPIVLGLLTGQMINFALHMCYCVSISVILGAFNTTHSARAEETSIGAVYFITPIMTMI